MSGTFNVLEDSPYDQDHAYGNYAHCYPLNCRQGSFHREYSFTSGSSTILIHRIAYFSYLLLSNGIKATIALAVNHHYPRTPDAEALPKQSGMRDRLRC